MSVECIGACPLSIFEKKQSNITTQWAIPMTLYLKRWNDIYTMSQWIREKNHLTPATFQSNVFAIARNNKTEVTVAFSHVSLLNSSLATPMFHSLNSICNTFEEKWFMRLQLVSLFWGTTENCIKRKLCFLSFKILVKYFSIFCL